MSLCRSALLAVLLLAAFPAAAHAATASVTGGALSYVASEGDENELHVATSGGGSYTVSDLAGHAIGVGSNCAADGRTPGRSPAPR